jgi:hypothetical protein
MKKDFNTQQSPRMSPLMRVKVAQVLTNPDDVDLVTNQLELFVNDSIRKFEQGHKEHGGSILSRPCLSEARKEIIDLNFYLGAIEEKKKDIVSELKSIICFVDDVKVGQRLLDLIEAINNL